MYYSLVLSLAAFSHKSWVWLHSALKNGDSNQKSRQTIFQCLQNNKHVSHKIKHIVNKHWQTLNSDLLRLYWWFRTSPSKMIHSRWITDTYTPEQRCSTVFNLPYLYSSGSKHNVKFKALACSTTSEVYPTKQALTSDSKWCMLSFLNVPRISW